MNKLLIIGLAVLSALPSTIESKKVNKIKVDENIIKQEIKQEEVIKEVVEEPESIYTTRMTSYWADDGYGTGNCTGSGLCSWDFEVNDKGWYTYQGKLVVATATTYLANQGWYLADGVHTYKYGDEITLNIDGVDYPAVVKDSCGNCMKTGRIDLFVSSESGARDTQIIVKEW